jgi:hypothetical protein
MNQTHHRFHQLFAQLGLAEDAESICQFINSHTPLAEHVKLHEAHFWSAAQAAFLREALLQDSDWAELVDQLSLAFRAEVSINQQ